MSLNRDQIDTIAHLARLALTEAEIPVYQHSLSKIVDFVGELDRGADRGQSSPWRIRCRAWRSACEPTWSPKRTSTSSTSATLRRSKPALYLVPKVIE